LFVDRQPRKFAENKFNFKQEIIFLSCDLIRKAPNFGCT
jgi:hypothetical protein